MVFFLYIINHFSTLILSIGKMAVNRIFDRKFSRLVNRQVQNVLYNHLKKCYIPI